MSGKTFRCIEATIAAALIAVISAFVTGSALAGPTERVSVDSSGTEGNSASYEPSISADGRYVAFRSVATNLVAGDSNVTEDVFVHDRQTGTTERVSVDSSGTQGNEDSEDPSISADGRYVAFFSEASNLVAGDNNGTHDIFVHDRQAGTTERVSVDSNGTEGNGNSTDPSISADGRYVAFFASASNLVAGDTNSTRDIFVHDRQTGTTERVSVDSSGTEGNDDSDVPSISADGRFVAFTSSASNLVAEDSNANWDVFVHDRQTGTTERVSLASSGTEANSDSFGFSISADGRYVAFFSEASNLVAGDSNGIRDIFVHNRQTGTTKRVSLASSGTEGNDDSEYPSISADGRYIAFESDATNLVAGDGNVARDIFVHDRVGFSIGAVVGETNEAGGQFAFAVELHFQPTADVVIGVSSSDTGEGTVSPTSLTFTADDWDIPQTVTVTGVNDDVDDNDQVFTVLLAEAESEDGFYDGLDPPDVAVANIDDDSAGITVGSISGDTNEDGGQASVDVVLNSQPLDDVVIAVSSSDTGEGTVSPTSLTFTADDWDIPQTVTVTGVNDDVDDNDQVFTVLLAEAESEDGFYDGLDPPDVAVANIDDDSAGITVGSISGDTNEDGGQASVDVVLNSQPLDDVVIAVSSSDTGEGIVDKSSLTFTAGDWDTA